MSEQLDDTAELVLLTFTTADLLDGYQERRDLSLPILIDGNRDVYAAYGLGRGASAESGAGRRFAAMPRSCDGRDAAWLTSIAATEDTRQLGGDFVVAPDGRLSWGYWSAGPADRPSVNDVFDAVQRAAA